MPGGKGPACSTPSAVSVSGVAAETLQRPEPATYVKPAFSTSVNCTLAAGAEPVFVYESVTVTGPEGDTPLDEDRDLVALMTELATVVVSVLVSVVGVVSLAETVIVAVLPLTAAAGTVPATTKRNVLPAAIGPEVLMGAALSGTPSPLASMKYASEVCGPAPKLLETGAFSVYVSVPLPVLVRVCG